MEIRYRTPEVLLELVNRDAKTRTQLFQKLKKMKPKQIDALFHPLHHDAFDSFDCLECANCCSSISPIVTEKDIDRLAKHFKTKAAQLIDQYFHMDSDGDYVFNVQPCPFLMPDNYCMVYESRPKACREYPHTDRNKMRQILTLTKKNCEVCPIVNEIIEELKHVMQ